MSDNAKLIVSRINGLIAEQGIPKKQFYVDCNITSSGFSQWKTGQTNPSMKKIRTIADYLKTTPEYLMFGDEDKKKKIYINKTYESGENFDDFQVAAHNYLKKIIDAEDRKTILRMLYIMAEQNEGKDDIGQTEGDLQ